MFEGRLGRIGLYRALHQHLNVGLVKAHEASSARTSRPKYEKDQEPPKAVIFGGFFPSFSSLGSTQLHCTGYDGRYESDDAFQMAFLHHTWHVIMHTIR